MGYPGAYEPVISVAASGWVGEWTQDAWWWYVNVTDPTDTADFYITDFSSRKLAGQDLDIAAPGSWVVGPYQLNNSNTPTYYFLGGTSMASPHVAGTVALMAQKYPTLTAADAEAILEDSAIYLDPGCRTINQLSGEVCWGADATGAGLLDAAAALATTPTTP
jgi:subtilisin family serine protease